MELLDKSEKKKCKGLIFRAENNTYPTSRGFAKTIRLKLSAKLSCEGCDQCGFFKDAINETLLNGDDIIGIDDVENGKYYSITTVNLSIDWETGYVDDYDLKLVEVEIGND